MIEWLISFCFSFFTPFGGYKRNPVGEKLHLEFTLEIIVHCVCTS